MAATRHVRSTTPGSDLLERRLRQALHRRELVVHYQPRVDAVTRGVVGVEALVRWDHPVLGLIGPAAFIPAAERTGVIAELGAWVLERACADAARWRREGTPVTVSVNVSPLQLELQDLPQVVVAALSRSGLDPEALELEITESLPLSDDDAVTRALARIHELGVVCAVDDFGKGYSLLTVLRDVPVGVVKIDKSCITGALAGVVELARSLGMRVVAEGVENEEQRLLAVGAGCHEVQGHLVSRPVPAARISRVLRSRAPGRHHWPSVSPVTRELDERALTTLLRQLETGTPARRAPRRLGRAALTVCALAVEVSG